MSAPLASRRLLGIVASHGVAVGPVMILDRQGQAIPRRRLHGGEAPSEQERLRRAIDASRAEIESVRGQLSEAHLRDYGLILDAHLLMHRDELLAGAAIRAIADDRMNAEWALRRTIESLKAPLLGAGSRYFRERAEDIEHVGRHILGHLGGGAGMALPPLDQPVILFSQDLSPADAARLLKSRVEGLVTVGGSPTGHTALLARALEVPAVVGVSGALELAAEARMAIVDGSRAEVWFDPDEACRQEAASRADRYRRFFVDLRARRREPARTRDGIVCSVFANVELPVEAAMVAEEGGEGIGLYRTEFLYLEHDAPPSEQEQVQIYSDVVRAVGDRPVTFRTFDLGGDKLPLRLPVGPNPALGQRGVRLSLAEEGQFREQVRALLKAAVHGDLRIMLPLISGVGELREARRIVEACARELEEAGIAHATVPIGVMIEVPSAALTADILAQEADFFSVGTNDLVQYTLAVDRSDPAVAYLADVLHPAVLGLLQRSVQAAKRGGIEIGMCGDMAADPIALPIALGLGFRDLSVPLGFLPLVRDLVRRIDGAQAAAAARDALLCATGAEVRAMVRERFRPSLGPLWEETAASS